MVWIPWPALPCSFVWQSAFLSDASVSQLFFAPAHICTCKAVMFSKLLCTDFFFYHFEATATLAWFSFAVSNSALLNAVPSLSLCPLYVPLCFVSLAALSLLLLFLFFLTSVWMCVSTIKLFYKLQGWGVDLKWPGGRTRGCIGSLMLRRG